MCTKDEIQVHILMDSIYNLEGVSTLPLDLAKANKMYRFS